MSPHREIEGIRLPDEFKFTLDRVASRFPKIATLEGDKIKLKGLTVAENVALTFFLIPQLVNEVIENINLVISDLDMLGTSHKAFNDNFPLRRFKLLVRTFFYEYGRFEDAFGYLTLWMSRRKYLTKEDRRLLMADFHEQHKRIFKLRNAYLHDDVNWGGVVPRELRLLEMVENAGRVAVSKKDGSRLDWGTHLAPQCEKMATYFVDSTSAMRTTWNMLMVDVVQYLIEDGTLTKSKTSFLKRSGSAKRTRS